MSEDLSKVETTDGYPKVECAAGWLSRSDDERSEPPVRGTEKRNKAAPSAGARKPAAAVVVEKLG
jgi:hypothetical protein